MNSSCEFLNPADAARQLGVSVKALRLYEERGLLMPRRTAAGWRAYGPEEMTRAGEIAVLRKLGFSLGQIGRVLGGETQGLEAALCVHQAQLESEVRHLATTIERVRTLRARLVSGDALTVAELARLHVPAEEVVVAFDLPWPWGGERFELRRLKALTYITGPLFSGKTKLAQRLAECLPRAEFVGLDRLEDPGAWWRRRCEADAALAARVAKVMTWLVEDGATACDALSVLIARFEADDANILVVDMVEQGLDEATQQALVAYLRQRGANGRPVMLLTRSRAILDLAAVGPNEAILYCPANHSPPFVVSPHIGAPGYEAVETCLASPDVRARTAGVVAWRPPAAAAAG